VENDVSRRIRLAAEAKEVARSVAIYAIAIALGVYVLATNHSSSLKAIMAGIVLLILVGATLQIRRAIRQLHHNQTQAMKIATKAEHHYFRVLHRVLAMVENRQPYSTGRSYRVSRLARQIARRMGLSGSQCRLVSLAGRVHDIGLLAVPETILYKRGRLAGDEFRIVQKHPDLSCRILQPLSFLADALPAIRYHHERMNGTGYPHELRDEQIPLEARILAVADSYDAMTHDRPHRNAMTPLQAVDELRHCTPAGYDPACVAAVEQLLNVTAMRDATGEPARELVQASS
jgi:HD-GYP domain-containing protein (c-di-GMP phosphodiesterase class II)